jgi:hypothetical protein
MLWTAHQQAITELPADLMRAAEDEIRALGEACGYARAPRLCRRAR